MSKVYEINVPVAQLVWLRKATAWDFVEFINNIKQAFREAFPTPLDKHMGEQHSLRDEWHTLINHDDLNSYVHWVRQYSGVPLVNVTLCWSLDEDPDWSVDVGAYSNSGAGEELTDLPSVINFIRETAALRFLIADNLRDKHNG